MHLSYAHGAALLRDEKRVEKGTISLFEPSTVTACRAKL